MLSCTIAYKATAIQAPVLRCSGPKPDTIKDLWRMIWQLKSNRVVMITKLSENLRVIKTSHVTKNLTSYDVQYI